MAMTKQTQRSLVRAKTLAWLAETGPRTPVELAGLVSVPRKELAPQLTALSMSGLVEPTRRVGEHVGKTRWKATAAGFETAAGLSEPVVTRMRRDGVITNMDKHVYLESRQDDDESGSKPLPGIAVAVVLSRFGPPATLIQMRARNWDHPNMWEFPGGKVRPGEGFAEAAARELMEELGVVTEPRGMDELCRLKEDASGAPTDLRAFLVRRWKGSERFHAEDDMGMARPREGQVMKWLSFDEGAPGPRLPAFDVIRGIARTHKENQK